MDIYREVRLDVSPATWSALLGTAADPPAAYDLLEQHLGCPVDREALRARRSAREAELLAREAPLPGVRDLIADAQARELRLAVASSSEREWVERHLERFGLLDSFDVLVCADDVERTKPFPDLYEKALRCLGIPAADAIAFEDSVHGVAAAKGAGVFCVAVPNSVTRHGEFSQADVVLPSLRGCRLDDLLRAAESCRPRSG